jgi:hypothetical protein
MFMGLESSLQELGQYITLASVLGGFAFAAVVELLVSDKKGKLATVSITMFAVTALMFLYALVSYVLVYSALTTENATVEILRGVITSTMWVILTAIFLLLASIGVAGWVHSKAVGIATTVAAAIFMCITMFTFFNILMAVPPAS